MCVCVCVGAGGGGGDGEIQSGFASSTNALNLNYNPGLNPHPLVDWNLIGSQPEVSLTRVRTLV